MTKFNQKEEIEAMCFAIVAVVFFFGGLWIAISNVLIGLSSVVISIGLFVPILRIFNEQER